MHPPQVYKRRANQNDNTTPIVKPRQPYISCHARMCVKWPHNSNYLAKAHANKHQAIKRYESRQCDNISTAPKTTAPSSSVESIPQNKEKASLQQIKTKKKSTEKTTSEESK